jgi:hypothetical protein
MRNQLRNYFLHSKGIFSTFAYPIFFQLYSRFTHLFVRFSRIVRIALGLSTVLFLGWFFAQFVIAEKEASLYVFPSVVTVEGFEKGEQSLGQDLSADAELVDFTRENSAFVFFGTTPPVTASSSAVDDVYTGEENTGAPQETPPVEIEVPTPSREESSVDTLPVTDALTPVIPSIIPVEIPTVDVAPTTDEVVAPSALREFDFLRARLGSLLRPSRALAHDVPMNILPMMDDDAGIFAPTTEEPAVSLQNIELPTEDVPTAPIESGAIDDSDLLATSSDVRDSPTLTPSTESADSYSVALCTTLGKPCNILLYEGFGLGGALEGHELVAATLELSLAGRGAYTSGEYDRVLVRAFHAGRWEFLGETVVQGDMSNGKRGGYLSLSLSQFSAWEDLADLKIAIEYDRTSAEDSSLYVDGLWVNVKYASLAGDEATPEDIALSGANIRSSLFARDAEARRARRDELTTPDGAHITFTNEGKHPDAMLRIKTDQAHYRALSRGETYFNVTNEGTDPAEVRMQFNFSEQGATVRSLARFVNNAPYATAESRVDDIGYFCDSGWKKVEELTYRCGAEIETRQCDALNADETNCIEKSKRVGLTSGVRYRNGWQMENVRQGPLADDLGIFATAIGRILSQLPEDAVPSSFVPAAHLGDSVLIQPGQTLYFRADIDVPLNGRGDFSIEAMTPLGDYGLAEASIDGSWNYQLQVDIDDETISADGMFAVPISLDTAGEDFWKHVRADGADIRFVDSTETYELPYWLSSFDLTSRHGLAWVRVPEKTANATTSIHVYFGDADAKSASSPTAPFRTDELTVRGMIFGGSQKDMMLHVIALDDFTRVVVGDGEEQLLKKGESALFENALSGSTVSANGPIVATVVTLGEHATYVPAGYVGSNFILPEMNGANEVAIGLPHEYPTYASLEFASGDEPLDPLFGSIVARPVLLGEGVPISTDNDVALVLMPESKGIPSPIYPLVQADLFGIQTGETVVSAASDGTAFTGLCSSGARQSFDGRRRGMTSQINACISGEEGIADAVRVFDANHPLAAFGLKDGYATSFLPESEFAENYISPVEASGVFAVCPPLAQIMDIGVYDPEGGLIASSTCEGLGSRPGKTFLKKEGASFPAGFRIARISASSTPFFAMSIGVDGESFPMRSAALSRPIGGGHPKTTLGEVAFVVPGEHRKLDVEEDGKEKEHVDVLLSKDREFSVHQKPAFRFQYKRQSNSFMQNVRDVFGVTPFVVSKVLLKHPLFGDTQMEYDVVYGENNEWSLSLKDVSESVRPGKYTLHIEIEEGGETYIDEFDFYWGVLAINYAKSIYTQGEHVAISLGAISNNGNTICDANLKLWITSAVGVESEVPVLSSGKCNGNNVVDVPDYTAEYDIPSTMATGTYKVKLVRLDGSQNIASQVSDSFEVRESVPYVIERVGPTRIYPLAHYPMKIRVRANEAFEGNIVERIPGDFVVIERGNADLKWGDAEHSFITATWPVTLPAGGFIDLEYVFDAGDRSPYLYLLGPIEMNSALDETKNFREGRQWQIASDAAGKMLLFLDQNTPLPAGWTCMSCAGGDTFYDRFIVGSSTYGGLGGTATHTPTAVGAADITTSTGVGSAQTNNTTNTPLAHTHAVTVGVEQISNSPAYKYLRVIRSTTAGDPGTIPAGAIGVFDVASSSLPNGWYRYSPLDGRYVRAASSTLTGGSNTHQHNATGTLAGPSQSGIRQQNGVPNGSAIATHTHLISTTTTNVVNNEPPYVEVLFAKLNTASNTPNYLIAMWDDAPPSGWSTMSNSGDVFDGKFLKASTTYGGTGGSSSHAHANISGATSTVTTNTNGYTVNASNAQAPAAHIHDISITGFSDDSHLPKYVEVIFAKRLTGITVQTQDSYWIYANANALTPTDRWPVGGSDLSENFPIDTADISVVSGDNLRLRMNVWVRNATSTVSADAYKLQYVASADCVNALNWTDVGAIGSGSIWRGYNNTSATNNATLPSLILSSSTVLEAYSEENPSTGNPTQVGVGGVGEWDWVLNNNTATGGETYCFRMVKSDGTPLDEYSNYPSVLTNAPPQQSLLATPFDNEKVGTTTPAFQFYASDPETNDLDYQIQVAVSATLTSPIIDVDSVSNPELFINVPNPSNKAPFYSGETIQYRPASGLTNGTTYWWRVRAKDTNASNQWGAWSATSSITIDTTVSISTWFQTTRDQFALDSLDGVTTTADTMTLIVGSTTGIVYSPTIEFSYATLGTAWGALSFTDTETSSDVKYHIEYYTSTSSWADIPDSALAGNGVGFDTTGVSLLGVDPETYATIRLRANLTNSGASPVVSDWTLAWDYNVTTPTLTAPFDNQKVATRTPSFEWSTTDPQENPITYQISWSTDSTFTSSTTRESNLHSGFSDLSWATDTDPFGSGDRIRYTIQTGDILASSTTYYWRVRGRDPAPGANTYSFWSPTRSIYIDTTVALSTWFQTDDAQFNTGTLTSLYTTGTGSTTVSTTTDEVMLAYGEGVVQTPRYRIFNGRTLGSELSAESVGATIQWLVLKASPIIGQYIMGTLGSDRDMNFQVYDNGVWGNVYEAGTNAPSLARRSFDVAYETISGRALAVSCNSSPDPDYRIWDGDSWAATGTINLSFTSNCEWVRLASSPTTNEIIGLFRNTGSSYEAQVWNATTSTWGNATSTGSMSEIANEGMAVEYEASGNQAVFVVSNAGNASFISNFWNGTSWAGASTSALGNDFEWGNLRRNVGNDQMALCYVDQDNDIGVKHWSGTGWVVPHTELDLAGITAHPGRLTDCMFEIAAGRTNYITSVYATTAGMGYRYWNTSAWVAEVTMGTPPLPTTFTNQLARTSASGTIVGMFFDHVGTDYEFGEHFGTQAWPQSKMQTIEDTASVTVSPYGEPFYMAAKNPTTQGAMLSSAIDFDDGVAPAWKQALWSATLPGISTFKVQVEYQDTNGDWAAIPDVDLPDNSTGTSTSPITLTSLNTTTYNVIRLKGNFVCVLGNCPTLNNWTVEWAAGVRISGIARDHDLTTAVTSGTVAIAVGGTIQTGKTGTIDASGNWFIDNVTAFPGNVLTVFVDGAADTAEAVAVAIYTGPGDSGGMALNQRWVTTGSGSTTGQVLSLANLGLYDNSVSGDEDIFYDVDAGNDYNNCVTGSCLDSSLYAYSNTLRFSTTSSETVNVWDLRVLGTMYGDTNTIKVSGGWRNLGTFIPNTGTVIFNATSSSRTIDSTGAVSATFYGVTFGESGSLATFDFLSALTATGTTAVSFGTTSPGAYALTLQGDLTIGASGTFKRGTATTTFSGATAKTWTDSSASKQDLGNVLIDGTAKTVTLASSVRAFDITIGADDILSLGGANTLFLGGSFINNNTFTALTGTVDFAATTTAHYINQGTANFYNTTFSGIGGTWLWQNTNATTTNDLLITGAGTTTLPSGTLAVGGSFNNTGGVFSHNSGVLRLTSTASGKTMRANGSSWNDVIFAGSGGAWTMSDTNATTTGTITVSAGTPTLNSGTLAVGNMFLNQGGTFTANGGTLKMTSALSSRNITLGGSSLASLLVSGAGTFTITDTNATSTADISLTAGTTVFPSGTFTIGGSLTNSGAAFTANGGLVRFNASAGSKTVSPGSSSFAVVSFNGAGNFTLGNATTTGNFSLDTVGSFTQTSGTTLVVTGEFANRVTNAATTWAGSILHLNSGTSYTLNTKVLGGDTYGALKIAASTFIRAWASSATSYQVNAAGSLYSQNHASTTGALNIFGAYARSSGTDYWSAAKDFDGTTLSGTSARTVAVLLDASATANFTNATLEVVGTSTATTTIDRISSGSYGITIASSTLNAQYYRFNHLNSTGLNLTGSTTITSLNFGNFELDTNGGTLLTMSSTTINHNSGLQIFNVRFALASAIAGFNVTETDVASASAYVRFKNHGGNLAGEANDIDPLGNPGNIRWDDSNFIISISGTVYSDAGATAMTAPTCDDVTPVVRVKVSGGGVFSAPCASGGVGTYTIPGVTFSGETVMTVYLNDAPGGAKATLVTKSASADLTGINLYQNRVIVRHEDASVMSISDMNAFDAVDDADISFTAATSAPNTLFVNAETEFWIWTGKTFIPNGNITVDSGGSGNSWDGTFHVDNSAVFTASGTEAHSVGGRFVVDSSGTFTSASSTFTFTATTSGKIITGVSALTFWNTVFNGSGGNWSVNQTTSVLNNMTITAGTVSGANSITVSGGSATGAGSIALTGGTFTLANGGIFGGSSDWSFYNLTLGSGVIGTTTKTGSSTVTASGVVTIAPSQVLLAGTPSLWNLSGGSTPLVVSGTLTTESAIFRYSGTTATTITPATYYRLYLAPTSGGPTYTLGSGTFNIQQGLIIGDGTNAGTTTINTNDPLLNVYGDLFIRATSTLVGSNSSAINVYGDWQNQGAFTHSSGTVNFVATGTGHIISASSSPFGSVLFNSSTGGWTIAGNATTTGALSLTSLTSLTVSPSVTLAVGGAFTNSTGGGATTWTNSTLYLNSGTAYTVNATTTGADSYGTLEIGANTDVRMWNSIAATTTVSSSGSLYSQDHNATDGRLQIWGDYGRSTGTDYWSYATDFDGNPNSSPRMADVRIATGSAITISGSGALEVLGVAAASTTIAVDTAGAYALSVSGGSTTMQYFTLRNTNQSGLNISSTAVINNISDGDFQLAANGGSMMTVAGATIDANPLKILSRNYFSTSSGITSGYNIRATGVSASIWRLTGTIPTTSLYGNFNGEAYDSDPGGDPGYIVWDDSAAQITISGNVYADEGVTPIGSPTCNGVTQNVRLKVQGLGSYASACNAGDGSFSISSVIFNPGDTLTLYLDTAGGARAANISLDPATNISNMHLYRDFIILRHEQGSSMTIAAMDQYDAGADTDVPFTTTIGGTNTLTTPSGIGLIVWTSKVFAPGGDVTMYANASSSPIDGTVKLYATSTWSGAASQTHRIGGNFLAASGAAVAPSTSTFIFNATTTGKTIAATSSLTFYNLTMSGVSGEWDISGVGTTSNNLTMSGGTTTLPVGTLAVGGSLDATGGVFAHNSGTVKFTSTASGKTVTSAGSAFYELLFAGAGGAWRMTDTNATTTGAVTVTNGTVTLPYGVLAVGTDFNNVSGAITASASSTVKMTSALTGRTIHLGGSSLGGLHVSGGGIFTITDTNATTTGDIVFSAGTTTLPINAFATYGSFTNQSVFTALSTSTMSFTATTGGKVINTGSSTFGSLEINGAGQFTISTDATSTYDTTIRNAGLFTLSPGKTLAVGGTFTNGVGGSATTWTNATLALNSGTAYAINTKSAGGDVYYNLVLGGNTKISAWNSTSTLYTLASTASLYSQDQNAVDGSLYIFGAYQRTTGTDYWSYATDFDGTALGGAPRQVSVRIASGTTLYFGTSTTLQILGSASASTTIDRQGALGNYALEIQGASLNAGYYQFRNTDREGLKLTGATNITAFNNGDFELGIPNARMISIASTTIDQNASAQYSYVRFATSTGVENAINVWRTGTTSNAITFISETGNLASEAYDEDGDDGCGSVRFTDSSCLFADQKSYRWRNDDGGEGVPSSEWYDQTFSKRKRVRLSNNTASIATSTQFKIAVTYDADMQSDFDDLRFTDSSGTTTIPFWVESYTASTNAVVWVKTTSLPASGVEDIFMYYGNSSTSTGGVGTTTFNFFDDFEDGSTSEYSGDVSLFEQSTSFNYERSRGLDAAVGSEAAQNTSGIGQVSAGIARDTTFRYFQYINTGAPANDEACFLFAIQSPITLHQNYGICAELPGQDRISISKNVAYNYNAGGATALATTSVTWVTGWYEFSVDWRTNNQIALTVYDSTGAFFASTSVTDSTYSTGGVGFTFWGQRGGWDIPTARKYISATPTVTFFTEQADSGATWKADENATLIDQLVNENVRLRLTLRNTGSTLTAQNLRLQFVDKGIAPNCESVASGSYIDVPTTSGGCGSSAACMKTSTQFSDKSSTTQLLSIPTGMTFTQGQVMEDPSNQTGSVTILSGEFTEVEYNFQMTDFATESSYCFRATKAGVAFDNYTKVAEVRILHVPSLSSFSFNHDTHIALTEGATTTIYATSTVTDYNGYADLVYASSTFYRSGLSSTTACTADSNDCYQIATTSCSFQSCSGNICTVSCSADMYYFADPTDFGSTYAAEDWVALIDVWDTSSSHDRASSSQEVYTVTGFTVPSTLSYGSVSVGSDTGATNSTTSVTNTGNRILNLNLSGVPLESGASSISYDKEKYSTSTFTYTGCSTCNTLTATTSPTFFPIAVTKPTSTSPFFKDIYWGITIPLGTAASTHTGSTTFEAVAG